MKLKAVRLYKHVKRCYTRTVLGLGLLQEVYRSSIIRRYVADKISAFRLYIHTAICIRRISIYRDL